jgi:uncharacterized protein (UPF0335 family)
MSVNNTLENLVNRIERLEEEKAAISGDIRDVYAEAKGQGFDPKILRKVVAILKKDKKEREMEEMMIDTYLNSLGHLADSLADAGNRK